MCVCVCVFSCKCVCVYVCVSIARNKREQNALRPHVDERATRSNASQAGFRQDMLDRNGQIKKRKEESGKMRRERRGWNFWYDTPPWTPPPPFAGPICL